MRKTRRYTATFIALALAASLAACSPGNKSQSEDASRPVPTSGENCKNTVKDGVPTVTVWAWYPEFDKVVDNFNAKNKDLQACWINAGAGVDEYAKFAVTLEAGKGAPDVIQVESDMLPGYALRGALADISKSGAKDLAKNYAKGTWDSVTIGKGVYAIPVDMGPLGMFYRQDIYDSYGIAVPRTWDEFADAAQKLKDAGATGSLANWQTNNAGFTIALLAQNGWDPFDYDPAKPKDISVHIDTKEGRAVLKYWFDLVDRHVISAEDRSTTDWQRNLITGGYASYIAPAWGTKNIEGIEGSDPNAQWRAAPLPQWDASDPAVTNWGGSNLAVTTQAPDKSLATRVAAGLLDDDASWKIGVDDVLLFPAYKPVLDSSSFINASKPFYGNQKMNKEVWVPAAKAVQGFTFGPTQQFLNTVMPEALADVKQGKIKPEDALAVIQERVIADLKTQGFTVR